MKTIQICFWLYPLRNANAFCTLGLSGQTCSLLTCFTNCKQTIILIWQKWLLYCEQFMSYDLTEQFWSFVINSKLIVFLGMLCKSRIFMKRVLSSTITSFLVKSRNYLALWGVDCMSFCLTQTCNFPPIGFY